MAARIDLTLDCANPARLAAFWKLTLGYEDEPPPAPFATRLSASAPAFRPVVKADAGGPLGPSVL